MEWECRSDLASEALPLFKKSSRYSPVLSGMKSMIAFPSSHQPQDYDISLETPDHVTQYRYFQAWGKIVSNYSKRQLTKSSDKFIAFSGVARALSTAIGEYVAGM